MWFLRKMAWPISLIYGAVVYFRNLLYDNQILKSKSFDIPTICVGNLSVGGTGKTPMIEFLISRLQHNYRLAVLSRGYKRKSEGFLLGTTNSTVDELGDEPFQILQKFPEITVAVDVDRRNGIMQLETLQRPDIILLDDAYQHRKVDPSFSILLTTYSNPYFKDWYLPTGNLRDSKYAAKRADCIVVTKCPSDLEENEMRTYARRLKKADNQNIIFSTLKYDEHLYAEKSNISFEDVRRINFTLVTGIANPISLLNFLKTKQLTFEHLRYADHHSFSSSEIRKLNQKGLVITTEKDYVRLQGKVDNLYYIRIEHQFLKNGEKILLESINARIKPYR